ncbi:retrovirus-related pol polyprotein from transposon TNT 1-94 [Tanacetum coccineum]
MLSSTVKSSTSASRSQPSGNTKKDKIQRTPSSTQKNKIKAHPRTVKSSLKNKNCFVEPKGNVNVQHSKLNANSELLCVKCNGCMLSDNHDLCRPTGQTFTIVGNACPLTRITTTAEVPLRKPTAPESDTPKPVVSLVYSRKPRKSKTNVPISKNKIIKSISANKKEPSKSWGSIVSDVPSSSLDECRSSKLFSVKFGNDHVAKILGYGDYQIGNVMISRVYYVEGLGHNLFSVGQFCDSNLEVAFRQHTCFIRNLEGVDLLIGSRGNNLYTLSLRDMMASSPICLLSKASKTKSWLCKKKPHKPKSEDSNQEKLYLLHMDLCGSMRVASVNGKKYILVIVDDYSQFTWVKCLRSKDEAPNFIIKFLKMIQAGISYETSVARSPQQNGVVERRNRTLIKATRTMLIYAKAPLFLWAEAVATAYAPSPSNSQTTAKTQSPIIPNDVEEDNHDLDVAHMNNDPFFGILILENDSEASSSDVIPTVVHIAAPNSEYVTKWTKDHPLDNIIGELESPISTRLQLYEQALFCYYDAFLTLVEPKNYKDALLKHVGLKQCKRRLMNLNVKLNELGGIIKNKARLVTRGCRQEDGINFEESFTLVARIDAI